MGWEPRGYVRWKGAPRLGERVVFRLMSRTYVGIVSSEVQAHNNPYCDVHLLMPSGVTAGSYLLTRAKEVVEERDLEDGEWRRIEHTFNPPE